MAAETFGGSVQPATASGLRLGRLLAGLGDERGGDGRRRRGAQVRAELEDALVAAEEVELEARERHVGQAGERRLEALGRQLDGALEPQRDRVGELDREARQRRPRRARRGRRRPVSGVREQRRGRLHGADLRACPGTSRAAACSTEHARPSWVRSTPRIGGRPTVTDDWPACSPPWAIVVCTGGLARRAVRPFAPTVPSMCGAKGRASQAVGVNVLVFVTAVAGVP